MIKISIIYLGILSCLLFSCDKKNKNLGGKEYPYSEKDSCCILCADTIPHELTISVTHENFDTEYLLEYKMVLNLHGTKVYEGPYSEKVKIEKMCKNNIVNGSNTLHVYLIKGNKLYSFNRKTSFNILKHKRIYVKLIGGTNEYGDHYQEKTDNDFFYSF